MSDLKLSELTAGKPIKIEKDGRSEGDVTDFKIECWLHGAEFDLRTGEALTPPAVAPIKTYSVSVDGDSVTVDA